MPEMTVYVDVLVTVNLFVNYVLLLCSSLILKNRISNLRLLAGAMIGSVYGLVIFLPKIPSYIELLLRIIVCVAIVFAAFGYRNIRRFLRSLFVFLAVTFAFGGIMLVLWVTVAPIGMIYNNGTVYFDIDLSVLAISTIVCFILVSLISKIISRRAPSNSVFTLTAYNSGRKISGVALCDTGNSLIERFSGYPVIIGEYDTLATILPNSVINYYEKSNECCSNDGLRFVVCKTVSDVGILPAFHPDAIEISSLTGKFKTQEVYIAVTKNCIGAGEFDFIISPNLFDGVKYDENIRNSKKDTEHFEEGEYNSLCEWIGNASASAHKARRTGSDGGNCKR